MMSAFPRIKHVPGSHADADDLVATDAETEAFFRHDVVVLEKMDGINVLIERGARGRLACGLKKNWQPALSGGLQRSLEIWAALQRHRLLRVLEPGDQLFGEWLYHRVSRHYRVVAAPLVAFALYRRRTRVFLNSQQVAKVCTDAGLAAVVPLHHGRISLEAALDFIGPSRFGGGRMEGLIFERQTRDPHTRWLKWVEPDYVHPVAGTLSGALNPIAADVD